METTVITASMMWPIMLLMWIGLFINTKYYKSLVTDIKKSKGLIIVASLLGMVLWSFMVRNHSLWDGIPEMIIFVVWAIMLFKSAFMLALPMTFTKLIDNVKYSTNAMKTVWLIYIIIGLYFVNYAYYGV